MMDTRKRTRALMLGTTIASAIGLGFAGPAAAEQVEVFSAGGTLNSTSEGGTGAMTSNASVAGLGGAPQEPRNQFIRDNYGRVNGQLAVEGGSSYEVTVALDGAQAAESATGDATARGFVEVELYDCCFAGEARLLTTKEAELPSQPGRVEVTQEIFVPQDTALKPDVLLHSYASAYTDTSDSASVRSSASTTTIDISPVGEPTEPPPPVGEPTEPPPAPGGGGGGGLVGDLLGGVGEIVGITRDKRHGTATVAMRMSEPAEMSLAGTPKVKAAEKTTDEPGTLRLKVRLRNDDLQRLSREAERKGRASVRVKVELTCDPAAGKAYSTSGHIRLVLED